MHCNILGCGLTSVTEGGGWVTGGDGWVTGEGVGRGSLVTEGGGWVVGGGGGGLVVIGGG